MQVSAPTRPERSASNICSENRYDPYRSLCIWASALPDAAMKKRVKKITEMNM